eukprot:679116-Pyramimonas_sp.AAC.1
MIADNSALVTVVEEQRGHLPMWGHPRDSGITGADHVPVVCSTDEDDTYRLDSDDHADMSKVVISEQRHRIFDFDRVTTMRVYVTAAASRAAVVKEDDLLTKADI